MIVNKYQGNGGGSGSGSTVSWRQDLSAGTQIARITINGVPQNVYAPSGGSSSGPVVVDLDALTQQERVSLYTELHQTTSADTINENYQFYKTFNEGNVGPFRVQLADSDYYGRIVFSTAMVNPSDNNVAWCPEVWIDSSGNYEVERINNIRSAPEKGTQTVGYFDSFSNYIVFDKGTSAFTDSESTALVDGRGFGGSFYWFVTRPISGDWANGVPILPFKVIDENDAEKMYYDPSISVNAISAITVSGVEYNEEFVADYGDFKFSMLLNSDPKGANFTFTEASAGSSSGPKLYILNEMTQAERKDLYDEIVPYGLNSGYNGVSSAFPANDYAFYVYLGNGHNWDIGDQYKGTVQMYVDYIHPDDYGGAVFFTGIVGSRQSSGDAAKKIRFIIDYQGNIDKDAVAVGTPDVSPFGFSYPDNGRLAYDVVNQKFVFINWTEYTWDRDVNTTGVTENIINSNWVDTFYDKGIFYASDRNAYATPNLSMTLVSGASVEIYAFPSIYVETLPSQITIDGVTFYKKYYLTYTKKDGSRFIISMLLNSDSKGAQFTYSVV